MKFRFANGDQPLSGFTIKRGVGVGGFGEVYFAVNEAGKEVALKQIQRNLEVEVRGVRHCLNLKHPNLIALFDIRFDAQEQGWIVMEYVAGPSLRDVIEQHPGGVPLPELMRWFGQIAAGVSYLHDHGIVHRDLKPANIFEDEGVVKIGDYGLSKFISCSRRGGQTESVGTFHYMAPEIGRGEYGKEIDIYALGIILYELATGMVPFDGESSQEIIMKHLTANPDLSRVDSPLREVIAKALAKNPASRYPDVRQMLQPLGLAIDDRYQLMRTAEFMAGRSNASAPVGGNAPQNQFEQFANAPPPKLRDPRPHDNASDAIVEEQYEQRFNEPIARAIQSGMHAISHWWSTLQMPQGPKTGLLVVAIIMLVINIGWILPLITTGLMFYVPYYVLWWFLYSPLHKPPRHENGQLFPAPVSCPLKMPPQKIVQTATPGRAVKPARPKPISVRQWRLAKRNQLSQVSTSRLWSETTGSWLVALAVVGVFCFLAGLFLIGNRQPQQTVMIGMIWTASISLCTAFVAIALGKIWQKSEGDWPLRSFIQLCGGFFVGICAFVLAEYLMVWPNLIETSGNQLIQIKPIKGFGLELPSADQWSAFTDGKNILLPAYLIYFPLMMGLIGWWRQADPLRRVRFSFWAILWSVIVASAINYLLVPFPQPWCALLAASASTAIQLSSPWINSRERLDGAIQGAEYA